MKRMVVDEEKFREVQSWLTAFLEGKDLENFRQFATLLSDCLVPLEEDWQADVEKDVKEVTFK